MNAITYDSFLEKEEFITAEEYLKRREQGKIDPLKTRIVPPDLRTGDPGGFMVELQIPRYRAAFEKDERSRAF